MTNEPIKKAEDGTYCFRANLGFNETGKRVQKYQSGFRTKKEARKKRYELLLQKDDYLIEEKSSLLLRNT